MTDDTLTCLVVQPERLEIVTRALTPFDRAILEQCAGSARDQRELIYRGTLRGATVPSPGAAYLQHLYRLLIPPDVTASTLVIAPHGILHALPFHALVAPDRHYLIERHACVYTPNLQVLQHARKRNRDSALTNPLVIGISQFGASARALPSASAEVDLLGRLFDQRGVYWREEQATRQRVLDLNDAGELAAFGLVHCATHAVLDSAAPHQSRVLLSDDALTTLDILDLSLRARLVTLSACQTAWSAGGRGDEMLSLARAFFYAGAQSLLATLWAVEDRALPELFARFYRGWLTGADAARALQRAQIELIHAGYRPFDWAAAILIGEA